MLRPIALLSGLCICLAACHQRKTDPKPAVAEPGISDTGSVFIGIDASAEPSGATKLECRYGSQGKLAKFQIELEKPSVPDKQSVPGFALRFGKGSFTAEDGSDATVLLSELKRILGAKAVPAGIQRVKTLPFSYVILGENQSPIAGGGFAGRPPGDWTATKISLEKEDGDTDEVFFNFNVKDHKAEFTEKDADFGDGVVAKLAAVL